MLELFTIEVEHVVSLVIVGKWKIKLLEMLNIIIT
jgi:hypothetical protein